MPGRTRLRVAGRRGDGVYFASVATGLSALPQVLTIDVRPLTGSILILHGESLAGIAEAARKSGLFAISDTDVAPAPTPSVSINPRIALGAGLGVLALSELVQGHIVPPAITLAWYAAYLTGLVSNIGAAEGGE
jgi:hypothetical protein